MSYLTKRTAKGVDFTNKKFDADWNDMTLDIASTQDTVATYSSDTDIVINAGSEISASVSGLLDTTKVPLPIDASGNIIASEFTDTCTLTFYTGRTVSGTFVAENVSMPNPADEVGRIEIQGKFSGDVAMVWPTS